MRTGTYADIRVVALLYELRGYPRGMPRAILPGMTTLLLLDTLNVMHTISVGEPQVWEEPGWTETIWRSPERAWFLRDAHGLCWLNAGVSGASSILVSLVGEVWA